MGNYKEDYKRVRFHIEFGPTSLFERVKYKMRDVKKLYLSGTHFSDRMTNRNIPADIARKLENFDINEWDLVTASVRSDRGKFVDSTWEVCVDDVRYWVTIGMGNYVRTIVVKDSSGVEKCVRGGDFYEFVERVNRELMDAEGE
jgi:predicted transcriptional regulator